MGTNYYLRYNICDGCGRFDQYHIGKDSAGWKFLFRIDENHKTADDWLTEIRTPKYKIYDEYNRQISYHDFIYMIRSKERDTSRIREYPESFTSDGRYDYSNGEVS